MIAPEEDYGDMMKIIMEIERINGFDSVKRGEIFPTDNAPVLASSMRPALMSWGLPGFTGKSVIINARAETVTEKPMFSHLIRSHRCVIPSTGFFEWDKLSGTNRKAKYLFNLPDEPLLYMAGFYDPSQKGLPRYVILTTAANQSISDIHNRMPVILQRDELSGWVLDDGFYRKVLKRVPPLLTRRQVA